MTDFDDLSLNETIIEIQNTNITNLVIIPTGFSQNITQGKSASLIVYTPFKGGGGIVSSTQSSAITSLLNNFENSIINQRINQGFPEANANEILNPIILAEKSIVKHYSKGTVFAEQDKSVVDSIFVVTSGVLELLDEKKGTRMHSGLITAGEVFGGISIMMNGGISLRTVIVDEDCSGYEVPRETFQGLCRRNKSFYEYFLENFSSNIIDESLTSLIETGQLSVFLAGVDPFSFLPEEELVEIAAKLSAVQYPKNTVLFIQGKTRIGHLYILHKGSAERYYEEAGKKTMHSVLGEGDSYGGISIL